jgi:hypothetical protein
MTHWKILDSTECLRRGAWALGLKMWRNHRVLSLFSSRRNWDSPTPSLAGECASLLWFGEDTLACERGWESPNSDEGTYTVVLYIFMYFVGETNRGGWGGGRGEGERLIRMEGSA